MQWLLVVLFAQVLAPAGTLQTAQPETVYWVVSPTEDLAGQNALLREMRAEAAGDAREARWTAIVLVGAVLVAFWFFNYRPLVEETKERVKELEGVVEGFSSKLGGKADRSLLSKLATVVNADIEQMGKETRTAVKADVITASSTNLMGHSSFPTVCHWAMFSLHLCDYESPNADIICDELLTCLKTIKPTINPTNSAYAYELYSRLVSYDVSGKSIKPLLETLRRLAREQIAFEESEIIADLEKEMSKKDETPDN